MEEETGGGCTLRFPQVFLRFLASNKMLKTQRKHAEGRYAPSHGDTRLFAVEAVGLVGGSSSALVRTPQSANSRPVPAFER
jgi:hypothetical protein